MTSLAAPLAAPLTGPRTSAGRAAPSGPRPLATARIQLTDVVGFDVAASVVPLLASIGVSHVYLSPVLRAVPGSRHGYDVVDPHHVDLDRGGEHAFAQLTRAAHDHELGVLLDVVPNHLASDPRSPVWADVLRHGRASRFARWFDLAWASGNGQVHDRILLPVLGTDLDEAIADGSVALGRHGCDLVVRVYDATLPLSNESLVELAAAIASAAPGPDGRVASASGTSAWSRVAMLADELRQATVAGATTEAQRVASVLGSLACDDAEVAAELDRLLAAVAGDPTTMRWVLDQQHYELAHWHEGTRRLDRRRFFDVAELVGVRQEDPEVFRATHARVLAMLQSGAVDGVRIDHPDGLSDPTGYLTALREEIGDAWLVVEKILSDGEELPAAWPVDGTVGYEHGAVLDRLFVAPSGEAPLTELVARHAGDVDGVPASDVEGIVDRARRDALAMLFRPELARLTELATRVCRTATFGGSGPIECDDDVARRAIEEMVVACPVYRTYVRDGAQPGSDDTIVLDQLSASAAARLRAAHEPHATQAALVVEVLRSVFDRTDRSDTEAVFVQRFQQLTSAVTAKGVEDTAFYRLPRLATLCEVGADPARWSVGRDEFHAHEARASRQPFEMVATSTHDSKRSQDARVRLAVLSEIPDLWITAVDTVMARLDELIERSRRDPLLDLLLIQFVVAVHPAGTERLVPAALKAVREAKRRTDWHRQEDAYEQTVERTVDLLVHDPVCRAALAPVLEVVVPAGRLASLAATLLVFAGPQVPDLYQAWPGWHLALADPDNRADLDPRALARLLADVERLGASVWSPTSIRDDERGLTRAHLVRTCLGLRREHPLAVSGGGYEPLVAAGVASDHVIAAVLGADVSDRVVVVGTRWHHTLAHSGGWRDTTVLLPPGRWTDVLRADGRHVEGSVSLDTLVGDLPGALLIPA